MLQLCILIPTMGKCPWSLLHVKYIQTGMLWENICIYSRYRMEFLSKGQSSGEKLTCSSCSGLHCVSPITRLTAYRLIPGGSWGRPCPAPAAAEPPCGEEGAGRLACSFNTNLFKKKKREQFLKKSQICTRDILADILALLVFKYVLRYCTRN